MTNKFELQKDFLPYVVTFCCSLLFTYISLLTDSYINHDAVFYMDAAKALVRDGVMASFREYQWPFYSFLVASVHMAIGLEYEVSAYLLNAVFASVTCVLFLKIYSEITERKGSLWVAAVLILSLTGINKFRADIMRDFGYWCFFLAGFLCLLRFYKNPRWLTAIGWQVFTLTAFLFRVEGVAIIFLGPLVLLFKECLLKERVKLVCQLFSLYFAGSIVIVIGVLFVDISQYDISIGRLPQILKYLSPENFFAAYNSGVEKIGAIFWYDGADLKNHYSTLAVILALAMAVYLIIKTALCMAVPYSMVFAYGVFNKYLAMTLDNRIVMYFAVVITVTLYFYMIQVPVITPRYTSTLVFMLLLLLGQIVERILLQLEGVKYRKKVIAICVIILCFQVADSLISLSGNPKSYIKAAGLWVEENVDRSKVVYSNKLKAAYYTDRGQSSRHVKPIKNLVALLEAGKFKPSTYLIVVIKDKDAHESESDLLRLQDAGKINLVREFFNKKKDDRALIFEVLEPVS